MTSNYRLILQSGASIGMEYPLEKPELILGRDASSDLIINDPEVSRHHARFTFEGNTYRIEDLGSTNGTFIQGQRITAPFLMRSGEIITLGEKVVLRFEVSSSDPNATVVAARSIEHGTQPKPKQVPPPAAAVPPVPVAPAYVPPPSQNYQAIPATPVSVQPIIPPVSVPPKKKSKALLILLIIAGVIVLFCVIPLIIIDLTQRYCSIFPGITNLITSTFFGTIGCP